MTMWMVRAGVGNVLFQPFLEQGVVAIGWPAVGDLSRYRTREDLAAAVRSQYPEWTAQRQTNAAGMLYRFVQELASGDRVITYDKQQRVYAIGRIDGGYRFQPGFDPENPNVRSVTWEVTGLPRDRLPVAAKNTLGSVLTLFRVPREVEQAVLQAARPEAAGAPPAAAAETAAEEAAAEEEAALLEDIESKSIEFIKDRMVRLDPEELPRIVAGVLRAMGYKTRVSPVGPDRGKDIVASPDGFGFEDPRIVVEVKHRPHTQIGSQDIRSFLGGRHQGDKGLYVSTGGFSKDARYEAERANIPVHLMNLDDLVDAVLDNYARMDTETQRLLPLKRIFWPLG